MTLTRRRRAGVDADAETWESPGNSAAFRVRFAMLAIDTFDFIRSSIKSVWALRLLLLLRDRSDRAWKIGELTREMRASELAVREALADFARAFVIEPEAGKFQYRPATSELERIANEIADAYASQPASVIRAIVSAPNSKIRSFADAFKLGKR